MLYQYIQNKRKKQIKMKKKQIKIKRQKMNPGQTRDKREIMGMKKRQILLKMKPGMKER